MRTRNHLLLRHGYLKLHTRCTSCLHSVSYFVLRCIVIWTACVPHDVILPSTGSSLHPEEVMVYPGYTSAIHYTVHYANASWLEAHDNCTKNNQGLLSSYRDDFYEYFQTYLGHENRSLPLNVWLAFYKDEMADKWHRSKQCGGGPIKLGLTPHNQSYSARQCLLLDTTIPIKLYAADCDRKVSYISRKFRGRVNYTSDAYIIYDNMNMTGNRTHLNATFQKLTDCIYMMFYDCFECYAAVYFNSSSWCVIYKTDVINLPMSVLITPTITPQTLILKNGTRVYVNDTTSNQGSLANSYSEYPCDAETPSASLTTEVTMETTGGCVCECIYVNKTREVIIQEVHQRSKELSVEKSKLSSYTRLKTSAKDDRTSSQAVGYVGILMITFTVILISTADVLKLAFTLYKFFLNRKRKSK